MKRMYVPGTEDYVSNFITRRAHCIQGHVSFIPDELKGIPEDVLSGYTKREANDKTFYDVSFKRPDIFPLVYFL